MLEKIYKAMFLTFENATELYEDAEILYKNGKIKRSYTFYHFSFEEGGRFFLLVKVFFKSLLNEIKPFELNYGYLKKNGFEQHIKKLDESVLKLFATQVYTSVLQNNTEQTEKLTEMYEELKGRISEFNNLKNRSIYISYIENEFTKPSNSITLENVDYMKELAGIQLINIKQILQRIEKEGSINNLKTKFVNDNYK
ncbi:AbiV family abortive infection protein [Sinomicrobium pectinilyticum]|uniref:AbiV family abortive infection protein n=1 Tax=Sinomicrobium pectinilyticum TaxID=1084421 RepID=UPI0014768005|nr:AbiV family abortive infection protein [Sinomicrobium pectinilyticum]